MHAHARTHVLYAPPPYSDEDGRAGHKEEKAGNGYGGGDRRRSRSRSYGERVWLANHACGGMPLARAPSIALQLNVLPSHTPVCIRDAKPTDRRDRRDGSRGRDDRDGRYRRDRSRSPPTRRDREERGALRLLTACGLAEACFGEEQHACF